MRLLPPHRTHMFKRVSGRANRDADRISRAGLARSFWHLRHTATSQRRRSPRVHGGGLWRQDGKPPSRRTPLARADWPRPDEPTESRLMRLTRFSACTSRGRRSGLPKPIWTRWALQAAYTPLKAERLPACLKPEGRAGAAQWPTQSAACQQAACACQAPWRIKTRKRR